MKEGKFKSLFTRTLRRYYLQPRLFKVNIEIRINEKFVLMDDMVIAHSGEQAHQRACKKVREELNIRAVGHRCMGKPTKLQNLNKPWIL